MIEKRILGVKNATLNVAFQIFVIKFLDYGATWRFLRSGSIATQMFIKIYRIKTVSSNGVQKVNGVGDSLKSEFLGIFNYSVIGMIQNQAGPWKPGEPEMPLGEAINLYYKFANEFNSYFQSQNPHRIELIEDMSLEEFLYKLYTKFYRFQKIQEKYSEHSELLKGAYKEMMLWSVFGHHKIKAL